MMNNTNTAARPHVGLIPMTAAQRREAARDRRRKRLQASLKAREFRRLIEASR